MATTKKTIKKPTSTKTLPAKSTSMWQYFVECFTKKYFTIKGRATRKELWSFFTFSLLFVILFSLISGFILGIHLAMTNQMELLEEEAKWIGIWPTIIILLPSISLSVRRLHDVNLSGWWYMIWIPYYFIFIVADLLNITVNSWWYITIIPCSILGIYTSFWRGTKGKNKYGLDLLK